MSSEMVIEGELRTNGDLVKTSRVRESRGEGDEMER